MMKHQIDPSEHRTLRAIAWGACLFVAVIFLSAFLSAVAGHVVGAEGADDPPPPPLPVYMPIVTSWEWGGKWQRVGNEVDEVEKFYSVTRCDVHGEEDQHDSFMLAGSDLGIYSRTSPSTDWLLEQLEQEDISASPTVVTFVPESCTQAYAAILGHGVWRGDYSVSAPKGWKWARVDDNQLSAARSVAIVPNGSNLHIYVAGDFGVKWLPQLPTTPQAWQPTNRSTLTTSLTTDGSVLASVWNDGVYVLVGNGVWSPLGAGSPPDKLIYEAVFDGSQGVAGTQSGASLWGGSAWQPLPAIQQTTFAVALDELGLFTGQRAGGIVASTDGGATWLPFNAGLGGVGGSEFQVRDLYVHPDDSGHRCVYAATTTGIWRWGTCQ